MSEYWYEWNKKYKTNRPADPKYRCSYVTANGRCRRMTTTIYCNQHADIQNKIAKGIHGLVKG